MKSSMFILFSDHSRQKNMLLTFPSRLLISKARFPTNMFLKLEAKAITLNLSPNCHKRSISTKIFQTAELISEMRGNRLHSHMKPSILESLKLAKQQTDL